MQHFYYENIKNRQEVYAIKISQGFGMSNCRPHRSILKEKEAHTEEVNNSKFPFSEAAGALMFIMGIMLIMGTRLDLSYLIGVLSRKLMKIFSLKTESNEFFLCTTNFKRKCIIYKLGYETGILECFSDVCFKGYIQIERSYK